jgi:hypothetical protein
MAKKREYIEYEEPLDVTPELYGETCKETFEDKFLKQTSVSNLRN